VVLLARERLRSASLKYPLRRDANLLAALDLDSPPAQSLGFCGPMRRGALSLDHQGMPAAYAAEIRSPSFEGFHDEKFDHAGQHGLAVLLFGISCCSATAAARNAISGHVDEATALFLSLLP